MTDRDRLIYLISHKQDYGVTFEPSSTDDKKVVTCETSNSTLADYLLANGVIVPPCKPIPLMKDKNPFNSDVYCPTCGTNLSGYYGDEPLSAIQCFNCGELLDNTKSITREEAEKALEGYKENI